MQKSRPGHPQDLEERRAAALTAAAIECAQKLGLSPHDAATLLGVAQGAFAAMKTGQRSVDGVSGEAERADALVRVTKCLQTLLGNTETSWRSWIRRENDKLGAKPLDLMKQRDGILKVASFLEQQSAL